MEEVDEGEKEVWEEEEKRRRRGGVEAGEKEVETVAAKNHLGPEKSVTVGASCVSPSCCSSLPLLSPPPTCPPPQIRLSPLCCETAGGRRSRMRRCERKCVHAGGDAAN